ncbi:hypothetical protein ABEF95_012289 [Exophiala dermatitidis]
MTDIPAGCGNDNGNGEAGNLPELADLVEKLQKRARTLVDELQAYRACLVSQNKIQAVEMRVFKRGVESEVKSLEKIKQTLAISGALQCTDSEIDAGQEAPQLHALRSSNLPFWEAVWRIAKSCRGISALGKRVYIESKKGRRRDTKGQAEDRVDSCSTPLKLSDKGVLVDIVAENGLEWIKVSTITEKRLLFEMAKEGWESYADFSDESEADESSVGATSRNGKLELIRIAEDLKLASRTVRVRFQHPRIRFVLPNIREGVLSDVDAFIDDLRAAGVEVQCGPGLQLLSEEIEMDFDRMLPAAITPRLTNTINIDCTILLALISDISHCSRQQLPAPGVSTYHKAILRQIEAEESSHLVLDELYPVLDGHVLECTAHAAGRMREIVQCMGTPSESIRADIILGEGAARGQSASQLRQAWSEHTVHPVPPELQFPIRIVDFDGTQLLSSYQKTARCASGGIFPSRVANRATNLMSLSPINISVFIYGWSREIVTFTSNRVVAAGLLKTINEVLDECEDSDSAGNEVDSNFIGPQIYICETARSLIGKAKSKG